MIQSQLPLVDSLLLWLGVSTNEAFIRNISTLENTAESMLKQ